MPRVDEVSVDVPGHRGHVPEAVEAADAEVEPEFDIAEVERAESPETDTENAMECIEDSEEDPEESVADLEGAAAEVAEDADAVVAVEARPGGLGARAHRQRRGVPPVARSTLQKRWMLVACSSLSL